MIGDRKGIGEEGAVTGGERGDDVANTWMAEGRPRGGADVPPEAFLGG